MGAQAKRKAISEAASEIPPQKRGRPPAFPAEWLSILQGLNPNIRSRHGLLNVAYRQDAIRLLEGHPECGWLCDYAAMQAGKEPETKWSLLTELGRLLQTHTPASVLKLAKVVCQQQPGVKDGVARLRRLRTGERPDNADQLVNVLTRPLDTYREQHPDVPWQTIRVALAQLQEIVTHAERW